MEKRFQKNYQCIRCGTKNKHFASDCFALNLKCKICSKVDHIAKACKANRTISWKVDSSSSNYLQSRPEEKDASEFISMNTVRRHASQYSWHTCMYTWSRCESPLPAPKQHASSVPLCNRFCILGEEPDYPAVTPAGSRGHVQRQHPEVKAVMTTATGSRGYMQQKRPQVADNSAPLWSTEQGQKKSSAIRRGKNSFLDRRSTYTSVK